MHAVLPTFISAVVAALVSVIYAGQSFSLDSLVMLIVPALVVIALLHISLLVVPAGYLLRRAGRFSWPLAACVGALSAFGPATVFALTSGEPLLGIDSVKAIAQALLTGAAAGCTYWALVRKVPVVASNARLLGSRVVLLVVALAIVVGGHLSKWPGELHDPDVKVMVIGCGNENDPIGTGMPAWPSGAQQFYTRQHWATSGELKVEVWEFVEPGHVLTSADRHVEAGRLVIKPRWGVPPHGEVAACYSKYGVEVTFRNLPRRDYVIDAR